MNKLLTKKEVCKLLQISLPTLNRYTKQGLVYYKHGYFVRFKKKDVDKWVNSRIKKGG